MAQVIPLRSERPVLDDFTRGYVREAIMFLENCPLVPMYEVSHITTPTLRRMAEECAEFQKYCTASLRAAYQFKHYTPEQAGADFYRTRNGHGGGFWDHHLGPAEITLIRVAKSYGAFELRVGDDGKLHMR